MSRNTNMHPYHYNHPVYNFLFHPLHDKDEKIYAIGVNFFLSIITFCLWQIPFWIVNRLDDRNLQVWKAEQSKASEVANRVFSPHTSDKKVIGVLDQLDRAGGWETCGFHALKNALVALGYDLFPRNLNPFTDIELYDQWEQFIRNDYNGNDLTIAGMTQTLTRLQNLTTDKPVLNTMKQIVTSHSEQLCILNLSDGVFSISGEYDLLYLANFAKAMRQGPTRFAFVIGHWENDGSQHWITLIMERDDQNQMTWQIANSWGNDHQLPLRVISRLTEVMQSPVQFIKQLYFDAIGEDLRRKADWIGHDGQIKPEDKARLMQFGDTRYKPRIKCALEMMENLGWLNEIDPEIQGYVSDVNKLDKFYKAQ